MTIRIPVKFLLFILYTAAVLAGAFGISYAVFEWRDDDADSSVTIEQLDERLDGLDGSVKGLRSRIDSVSSRVDGLTLTGPSGSRACHDALLDFILVVAERASSGGSPALVRDAEEAVDDFNRSC